MRLAISASCPALGVLPRSPLILSSPPPSFLEPTPTPPPRQEYRRQYGLEPLVKDDADAAADDEGARVRATVDEACPKCGHAGMEFYTMQLRSADEGQTVFYECPECRYKYSTNT